MDNLELPRGNPNRSTFYRFPPRDPNRSISPQEDRRLIFFRESGKDWLIFLWCLFVSEVGKLSVHMSGKGEIGHATNLETGKI